MSLWLTRYKLELAKGLKMNLVRILIAFLLSSIIVSCENPYAGEGDYDEYWICSINIDDSDLNYHYKFDEGNISLELYFTPDYSKVIYNCRWNGLISRNLDGSDSLKLITNCIPNAHISISPDCLKITYDKFDIFILDINGQNHKNLTNSSFFEHHPKFSTDSKFIIYTGKIDTITNRVSISMIDFNGNLVADIIGSSLDSVSNYYYNNLYIHPNGNKIYYTTSDSQLCAVNIDGTDNEILFKGHLSNASLSFSEDGTKAVFTTNRKIYLINEYNEIIDLETNGYSATISNNGEKIIYSYNNDLMIMNNDGSNKNYLTKGIYGHFSQDDLKIYFIGIKTIHASCDFPNC